MGSVFEKYDFVHRVYEFQKAEISVLASLDADGRLSKEMKEKYLWVIAPLNPVWDLTKQILGELDLNYCKVPSLKVVATDCSAVSSVTHSTSLFASIVALFPQFTNDNHLTCSVEYSPIFNNTGFPGSLFWTYPNDSLINFDVKSVKVNVVVAVTDMRTKATQSVFKYIVLPLEPGLYGVKTLKDMIKECLRDKNEVKEFLEKSLRSFTAEYNLSCVKRKRVTFDEITSSKRLESVTSRLFDP